jgi:hypothetical protein
MGLNLTEIQGSGILELRVLQVDFGQAGGFKLFVLIQKVLQFGLLSADSVPSSLFARNNNASFVIVQ